MSARVALERGWSPGAIGWVVAEHGAFYARHWGLGAAFEAKVAAELGSLLLHSRPGDLFLLARDEAGLLGSISVDGLDPASPRIRFFIVAARAQGRGVGGRLLDEAMAVIAASGARRAWLTTFAGLDAARRLYEARGFRLDHEAEDTTWGVPLREQRFGWTADLA